MKKTLKQLKAVINLVVGSKPTEVRGGPIEGFPYYWALIPVVPERQLKQKRDFGKTGF